MEVTMKAAAQIIPGLPNDVATLCLLKVPRIYHACLSSVCVAWRKAVRRPEFYRERRRLGIADAWLVVVSAEIVEATALLYSAYDLSTRQLLFTVKFPPSARSFSVTPADQHAAAYSLNYMDHYRMVAMNEVFAVLGFDKRRNRLQPPRCTFTIYNTVSDEWREAAPLSVWREACACGVIGDRLYVAGGMNGKGESERTTEVYDFETDTWSRAAALPVGVGKVAADAVFQGKLYLQSSSSSEASESEAGFCFWVYSPQQDKWEQEGARLVGQQQLLATDKFLYAIDAQEQLFRYEPRAADSCEWKAVARKLPSKRTARPEKWRLPPSCQKAFGNGDDIFFLNDSPRSPTTLFADDHLTRCHRLFFVKPTWYHAGAVVRA